MQKIKIYNFLPYNSIIQVKVYNNNIAHILLTIDFSALLLTRTKKKQGEKERDFSATYAHNFYKSHKMKPKK